MQIQSLYLIQWYLIVVSHWLVLWCHRCLTRPWFLWRKLSCSHDLTAVSWSHSSRCWRSHVYTHELSHAHLSGTITSASHRCLQVNFQCHQRLVVDDKNFSLQTLHTWSINTMLFQNYWAPFSSSSGKATYTVIEKPETVPRSACAQGLKVICLLMAVQKDSEGLESARLCPWKQTWTK